MGNLDPVFAAAAGVSVVSGVLAVTRRNPVYSAVFLLVCFLAFAVIYLRLGAPFLAAMHVLVYTGAILVLFLFVIMLLNLKPEELGVDYPLPLRGFLVLACAGLFALLAIPLWREKGLHVPVRTPIPGGKHPFGSVSGVGELLFGPYALPFELISVLILVAIFGGVILAKKKL